MKSTLDSMEFILEICARSLPPDADAIHRSRITYLAGRIVDAIS